MVGQIIVPAAPDIREHLIPIIGKRTRFRATVARFGRKKTHKGGAKGTIMLADVALANSNANVTSHIWFTESKAWKGLRTGTCVEFDARVVFYTKGYKGKPRKEAPLQKDLKLERPTKVTIIN